MNYQLDIITPNGKIFEGEVDSVVAPGRLGSFGVLARHTPFISSLVEGVIKIGVSSKERFFAIPSGILEVNHDGQVLILSDDAIEGQSAEEAFSKLTSDGNLEPKGKNN